MSRVASSSSDMSLPPIDSNSPRDQIASILESIPEPEPEPEPVVVAPDPAPPKSRVPPGYQIRDDIIDQHLVMSPALVTYVDKLFPLPRIEGAPRANYGNQELRGELKPFTWVLRMIVMIVRNGFEVDSLTAARTDFMDLVTEILTRMGKNVTIVERIKANLVRSLIHWRPRSLAVQFFLMFMSGEYTVPDFRFVNMLFSLCFEALYPPVDVFLDDGTLVDDNNGFLIHRNFFDKVCQILLRIDEFPEQNIQNILAGLQSAPEYPDLLPFWLFAREMITLFKDRHVRFHKQIRNIFKLVGGSDADRIGRDNFPDFVKMVNPGIPDIKIRDMWQTMILLDSGQDRPTIPFPIFVRFCGDYPGMSRWIGELTFLDTFDRAYKAMTEPMLTFFDFLRKRFTEFIPLFLEKLGPDLKEAIFPYVKRMRNGFLRCEISTCSTQYRYIMQYVDLKLTEQHPFEIITPGVTNEDVARMINHVMMRETLASLLLRLQQENDSDKIIRTEAAFAGLERRMGTPAAKAEAAAKDETK
jgi:hypothetical protein